MPRRRDGTVQCSDITRRLCSYGSQACHPQTRSGRSRALVGGRKPSLPKKVEAEAAAKPSMRSPRVIRSTATTDPDGACCKPAVGARPRPAQSCIRHRATIVLLPDCWRTLHAPRCTRPHPWDQYAKRAWDHRRHAHIRHRGGRRSWCTGAAISNCGMCRPIAPPPPVTVPSDGRRTLVAGHPSHYFRIA